MRHAGIVLLVVVAGALGACDDSGSSNSKERSSAQGSTTTGPPPVLELATPDGFRHSFRVVDTRLGLGNTQAVANIEIANPLDRRDTRLNRPHGETRRLMIGIHQERFGGVCPPDRDEPYDYDIYVAAAGYCVITRSALSAGYDLPREPGASKTITLTADLAHTLGVTPADIGVFFFDPLLALTPVLEMSPQGATYGVEQNPACTNPVSGELRPECEAAFHPDLLIPVP